MNGLWSVLVQALYGNVMVKMSGECFEKGTSILYLKRYNVRKGYNIGWF